MLEALQWQPSWPKCVLQGGSDTMSEPLPAPHQPAAAGAGGPAPLPSTPPMAACGLDGRERSPRRVAREQNIFQKGMLKGALTVVNRVHREATEMSRGTDVASISVSDEVSQSLDRATAINKVLAQVMASAWCAVDELNR